MNNNCIKIVNWNIAITNRKLIDAINHVLTLDADIICLQEVWQSGLDHLLSITDNPFKIYYTLESKGVGHDQHTYLITLVKLPCNNCSTFDYSLPIRTSSIWSKFVGKYLFKLDHLQYCLVVDVKHGTSGYQIVNIHLPWSTGPLRRLQLFSSLLSKLNKSPRLIICGDLNIFGIWYLNFLASWVFGYQLKELWYDERTNFEKLFKEYGLANLFRGESLWPWLGLAFQLDHILVPTTSRLMTKNVPKKTYGSDHRMLICEVKL